MFKKFKIPYLNVIPVALILMLLYKIVINTELSLNGIKEVIYACIAYFVWGFVFAYLLNPAVAFFEKLIKRKNDSDKIFLLKRGAVIAFVYLLLIGVIALFIVAILPSIRNGINDITENLPHYTSVIITKITDITNTIDPAISETMADSLKNLTETLYSWLRGILDMSTLQSAVDVVKAPVMGTVRLLFGLVVSVYLLFSKERILRATKKLVFAITPKKSAENIISKTNRINRVFVNYLVSKVLQSFIMFIIGLLVLVPLKIPLAPLISLIIAVFNMIPYFGPYIGAIPCIILAFFTSPISALWVLIYSIAIQIIDNIIVGPKIMSSQVGISPLLVILGVTIGGQLGGVLGMFLGVPVVAAIKLVFYDDFIEKRLKERDIKID